MTILMGFDRTAYERRLAALDVAALTKECRTSIRRFLEWPRLERQAVICCQLECQRRGLDFGAIVEQEKARRRAEREAAEEANRKWLEECKARQCNSRNAP